MKSIYSILLLFLLFSCSSDEKGKPYAGVSVKSNKQKKLEDAVLLKMNSVLFNFECFPELSRIINKPQKCKGGFWKVILKNDSTTKIQISYNGNKTLSAHKFGLLESRHFHFIDENENFLILRTHTGSDWWNDLLIPLNKNVKEYYLENTLAYDSTGQYVAVEGQGNTLFVIINLINGSQQAVLNSWKWCEASSNDYCVKNVYFRNGQLFWEQYSPNCFEKSKEYSEQKVRIHI